MLFKTKVAHQKPVIRTETIYATSTIPISFGNKKTFTTITSKVGVTTVTEYQQQQQAQQRTVASQQQQQQQQIPALNQLNPAAFNPLGQLPQLQPSFTVTSRPVVKETELPSTILKEIKITFRNVPTVTTLTSTTIVSTRVTEYVTQTVRAAPTLNPGLGLAAAAGGAGGYNPLAALLG